MPDWIAIAIFAAGGATGMAVGFMVFVRTLAGMVGWDDERRGDDE